MPRVNNDIYRRFGAEWWNDDFGGFSSIRYFVNPVRFGYFMRVLKQVPFRASAVPQLLDVGCGGGFLTEEFARSGFEVTGVDPAPESVDAARTHARDSGLTITYLVASGECLPFAESTFDYVSCCDVLEHVDDVGRVIGEISRVLKPGGLFFYDTVNRTFLSRLLVIKVMQEWRSTAFVPPNSHVWEQFIKPRELITMLERHGLEHKGLCGISPGRNLIASWLDLRRGAKGKITFKELGRRLALRESAGVAVSYMGYAEKRPVAE